MLLVFSFSWVVDMFSTVIQVGEYQGAYKVSAYSIITSILMKISVLQTSF